MKHIIKSPEPVSLKEYKRTQPQATWEAMRNDLEHGGNLVYQDCRRITNQDQSSICAYCECKISLDETFTCRLEHFHDKSDTSSGHNWSLEWNTMLAVCFGGEREQAHPLPANLSCDAHKNHMKNLGQLSHFDGWILNPLQLHASPSLFDFDKATGCLVPNAKTCASVTIEGNQHSSTQELIEHTINILNLNCDRLKEERRKVLFNVESLKKAKRLDKISPAEALPALAKQLFQTQWPAFFTTIRCLLGQSAEDYLQYINYQG